MSRCSKHSMESSSSGGACLSPESTVTSLLSSSGHLRSSLEVPEHNTTFRYKYKIYDSASAALNAYIADFNSRHLKEKMLTGNLNISPHFPSVLSRPRVTKLKNKDVLREHLTDRELDFLSLPEGSLHHSVNRDRVSMTTDELLSIPYDGSMPVTHTSAFIQGLSQSGVTQPGSSRPAPRPSHDRSTLPGLNQQHRGPRSFRSPRAEADLLKPEPQSERVELSSSLHLPHWLTSNKSDMDGSQLSLPDLKYPPWVQCCDHTGSLCEDQASGPEAPSWVSELEDEDSPGLSQGQSQRTLRSLRLQFAEQISLLAAERTSVKETLSRDSRMEALLQKADQVLTSLTRGCATDRPTDPAERSTQPITQEDTPPHSQEMLSFSSSQCQQESLEAAAGGATTPPNDREVQAQAGYGCHGNSVVKQPGPAEALKQVLFRLQAVEAELQHQQAPLPPAQEKAEPGPSPDGLSLQRALHHLTHLKALVEEPRRKQEKADEEEAEKDEDEGRYSSSSADGFACV